MINIFKISAIVPRTIRCLYGRNMRFRTNRSRTTYSFCWRHWCRIKRVIAYGGKV